MRHLFRNFRKKLLILGMTGLFSVAPAVAGVPGGNSNVNVNVTTNTVNLTEFTEVMNDVILESLWEIVGKAEQRNVWRQAKGHSDYQKFWEIEVTVSEADFASALTDVKAELYDLTAVPGRRNQFYEILQDEQTGQRLDQVSQTYDEVLTNQTSEFNQTVDSNGAQFGVDYIGDPNDYSTWIAIGANDVNVDVNQVTTNTSFFDAVTTTEYNQVAVWSVSTLRTISPILLDMDGDGAIQASGGKWLPHKELHRERMAFFDFHGDKFPVLMEWPGPNDGILCEPQSNGDIDGTNLFGTASGFRDGYEALRTKDQNGDGYVKGEELNGLAIWTDSNSDARPQSGEVKSLAEHNITSLAVKHKRFVASFVQDGETKRMFDWWPQTFELNRVRLMPKKT